METGRLLVRALARPRLHRTVCGPLNLPERVSRGKANLVVAIETRKEAER